METSNVWYLVMGVFVGLCIMGVMQAFKKDLQGTDRTYYDEDTMNKVYSSLRRAGLNDDQATDAVTSIQNRGILFRERL